jgi:hypothetical protein
MVGLGRLSLAELQAFKAIIEGDIPTEAQIDAAATSNPGGNPCPTVGTPR